jgi:MFS family permease
MSLALDQTTPFQRAAAPTSTLILASLGGMLEFYDFIIYVYFADVIGRLFFPPDVPDWLTQLQTFAIFGVGYFARPLGGVVMAHFGDRFGRKRMFMLSVFLMAIPTFLIGCLPVYASLGYAAPVLLAVMRILQGAAIGGEAPGAWVFVAEHARGTRTGFACGMLGSGLTLGILLGSFVSSSLRTVYGPSEIADFAWRIPFILGGVFGIIALYLRRWLSETPVFESIRARQGLETLPIGVVLRQHLKGVMISVAMTWTVTAIIVVMILLAPRLIQKLDGIPAPITSYADDVATVALVVSNVVMGVLIDRLGTRIVAAILCPLMIVAAYAMFSPAAADPPYLFAFSLLVGLSGGLLTLVPVIMVRAFPDPVRFTGVSFSYNVAYAVAGGITPVLVQALVLKDRFGPAHYVAACMVLGLVATFIAGTTNQLSGQSMAPGDKI